MKKIIILSISGASGSLYGIRLLKALLEKPVQVKLIVSRSGEKVLQHETSLAPTDDLIAHLQNTMELRLHREASLERLDPDNLFASPASGSFRHHGMVIVPCSMKTVGAIATGIADNLLYRAADVCLKEKRPLILVPRETPYNRIHLKNMLLADEAGAVILPASPAFYASPASITDLVDTVIARILDHLHIEHDIVKQWGV